MVGGGRWCVVGGGCGWFCTECVNEFSCKPAHVVPNWQAPASTGKPAGHRGAARWRALEDGAVLLYYATQRNRMTRRALASGEQNRHNTRARWAIITRPFFARPRPEYCGISFGRSPSFGNFGVLSSHGNNHRNSILAYQEPHKKKVPCTF